MATTNVASISSNHDDKKWSQTISFAQAESDFTASDRHADASSSSSKSPEWSHTISSYVSAESDFTASDRFVSNRHTAPAASVWSGSLSFAAPESDFVAAPTTALGVIHKGELLPEEEESSNKHLQQYQHAFDTLSSSMDHVVDAPETALGFVHVREFESTSTNHQSPTPSATATLDYYLSQEQPLLWTSPESATGSLSLLEFLDDNLKQQLLDRQAARASLPTTIAEAMQDERPIVITSARAPFHVQDVNQAWEGLCGYSRQEAQQQTVADLLQGPATEEQVARDMVQYLRATGFSEAVLTNYKKNGETFTNHIQVGVVRANQDDNDAVANDEEFYFVGVLESVDSATNDSSSRMTM